MAEQANQTPVGTAPVAAPVVKQKRSGKKGRLLTFIYKDVDGNVQHAKIKTNAFAVTEAWKDCIEAKGLKSDTKLEMTFAGQLDPIPNKLRTPKIEELMKIAGLEID